jgi:hypothetical protein
VHLLLPFIYCRRDHRAKLVQYVENITLAQVPADNRASLAPRAKRPVLPTMAPPPSL